MKIFELGFHIGNNSAKRNNKESVQIVLTRILFQIFFDRKWRSSNDRQFERLDYIEMNKQTFPSIFDDSNGDLHHLRFHVHAQHTHTHTLISLSLILSLSHTYTRTHTQTCWTNIPHPSYQRPDILSTSSSG